MSTPSLRPAELDDDALEQIRDLEEQLGSGPLVAYHAPDSPYADLTEEQVADVRRVEHDLGVRLLAYRR